MRIINIMQYVGTQNVSIDSFAIIGDQSTEEIIGTARDNFKQKLRENGVAEQFIDEYTNNGFYGDNDYELYMIWSQVG